MQTEFVTEALAYRECRSLKKCWYTNMIECCSYVAYPSFEHWLASSQNLKTIAQSKGNLINVMVKRIVLSFTSYRASLKMFCFLNAENLGFMWQQDNISFRYLKEVRHHCQSNLIAQANQFSNYVRLLLKQKLI